MGVVAVVAIITVMAMASCRSTTIAPDHTAPKSSAGGGTLNLDEITRRIQVNDTINIHVNIIMPSDRLRLEAEIKKKEKETKVWKYIAAGMLLVAGGSYFLGL